MKAKVLVSLVILAAFFSSTTLLAQPAEGQKPQLYMFWTVVVHPDKVAQFEEASKKQLELYKKHEFAYPWSTSSTDDGHYYFGIPIDNLGMIEEVMKADEAIDKKLGDDGVAIQKAFEGTMESTELQVWSLDYDLSYHPENARLTLAEEKYFQWMFIYYKPGSQKQINDINMKWKALYESKNVTDRYTAWVGGLGTEMPVHCYGMGAKDAVDYHTRSAELEKAMGEETGKLWNELSKYVRKMELKIGRTRPDLSMIPFSERQPTTAQ